jgi:hypothetical protein
MYCRICGTEEKVAYRPGKLQALCDSCNRETPRKVSRSSFDRVYWKGDPDVGDSIKSEFYSDYLSSECTLSEYIEQTTFAVL